MHCGWVTRDQRGYREVPAPWLVVGASFGTCDVRWMDGDLHAIQRSVILPVFLVPSSIMKDTI